MLMLIKILKIFFVVALIAVIGVFGVYFGAMSLKQAGTADLVIPETLGYYPSDLIADDYIAEFDLEDFLNGGELHFQKKDYKKSTDEIPVYVDDIRTLKGTWDNATKTYTAPANEQDAVYDAISIFLIGCFNESTVPYYQYYLDAGGTAAISNGALTGGLMVQGIVKVNNTGESRTYYKEQINALANVQANEALIKIAEEIPALNKAVREATLDNRFYRHWGNSSQYVTTTPNGQFPEIACMDEGYTIANWAPDMKQDVAYDQICYPQLQDADCAWKTEKVKYTWDGVEKERDRVWGDCYSQKYIIDLQYDVAQKWFTGAEIKTVFLDAQGNPSDTQTEYWYLETSFAAKLPELSEGFDDMEDADQAAELKAKGFYDLPINDPTAKGFWQSLVVNTGADPVIFTQLKYVGQVWNCGVFKEWRTEEGWFGTLAILTSNVKPYSPSYYSYEKEALTKEAITADIQANILDKTAAK